MILAALSSAFTDGRTRRWKSATTALLVILAALVALLPGGISAAPEGNNPPTNIACQGWQRDTVLVSWKDNDNDEANYRVERSIDGGAWTEVGTVNLDENGNYPAYRDTAIDVNKNYRYRVRGAHGDGTFTDYSPVCDNRRIFETTGFRIFYGLQGIDDCPTIDGNRVCLTDTNASGNNVFVALQANALEGSADAFQRVGFDRDAAVANGGLDRIPVNVVWCDGGGCAGGSSLGLSPMMMEAPFNVTTRAGDPIAYLVAEHEVFHFQQFKYGGLNDPNGAWVIEGQARSTQDKICIGANRATALCFDDIATGSAGYVPQVNAYLSNPSVSITQASYSAALFWTYLTEKFGTSPAGDSVEGGMNLMVEFWKESAANPNRDGIAVLNSTLQTLGHTARFRDIWKDFAVANFAKNLTGSVPNKYKYADMAETGGNYNAVARTVDEALSLNEQFTRTGETVYSWAAKYYVFSPDSNVPVIDIRVTQDSNVPLYYTVLGVKNNGIVHEYNYEGRNLNHTVLNNSYAQVVVVVAGLENLANYRVSVNGTQPTLNILTPTTANKARVGDPAAPDKFRVAVELLAADGTPLAGVDLNSFNFRVGSQNVPATSVLTSARVQGQQWFVIRAPTQAATGEYDLYVDYAGSAVLSETQTLAVNYAPRIDSDNMLVIDRSGSMGESGGAKLDAAKNAARLYVDSWRAGDKIGIVSFDHNPTLAMQLADWSDAPGGSREQALGVIGALTPGGATNIGDSLMMGFNELNTRGNAAHDWALVLLSDGVEEGPRTVDFDAAINNIATATGKRPVIHAVAIGPNADGPRMQNAATRTGGTYQFVSAPTAMALSGGAAIGNPRLDLDARFRYIATEVIGHEQFFTELGPVADGDPFVDYVTIPVEGSAAELVLSLSLDGFCDCFIRLEDANGTIIAPHESTNRHAVWRVSTPVPGNWKLTIAVRGPDLTAPAAEPDGGNEYLPPYLVHAAVDSDVTLDVDFPVPPEERTAGVPMPIVASLTDVGPITGASVLATVQMPSGAVAYLYLYDDGTHGDGEANDGVYGNTFYQTGMAGQEAGAGSYTVRVNASGTSALAGPFTRQQILSFFIFSRGDEDVDGLPDEWEEQYGGDPTILNPSEDPDGDGRPTGDEWADGTDPTDPDTDNGGESDGSEYNRPGNPFDPSDDAVEPTWTVAYPGVSKVFVRYAPRAEYALVQIYKSTSITGTFSFLGEDLDVTGMVTDTAVINDQEYCYYAIGITAAGAQSAPLTPSCTTPKSDPWPPDGAVLINGGASMTLVPDVTLTLHASDDVSPHVDTPDPLDDIMRPPSESATEVTEMRISNNGDMSGATWEPFAQTKPWTLVQATGLASVYVQYRDAAGNESRIIPASIWVEDGPSLNRLMLPLIMKP